MGQRKNRVDSTHATDVATFCLDWIRLDIIALMLFNLEWPSFEEIGRTTNIVFKEMEYPCSWKRESPNHFHVHPHHSTLTIVFSKWTLFLEGGHAFLVLSDKVCIIKLAF